MFDPRRDGLRVGLESPLPTSLPVGRATAVFCLGSCFHSSKAVTALEICVDGVRSRPAAWGMPRPDVLRASHGDGSEALAYRSGFWATIPLKARDRAGAIELRVAARLAGGAEVVAPLGRIEVVAPKPPPSHKALAQRADRDLIAVCMATFDPDMVLFRSQLDSLRAQTDTDWICLMSDDCSEPERFEEIEAVVAGDGRFVVSRSDRRLGFYRNFERALEMVPERARLVALCDQDDRWYPEKLAVLRATLGSAQLVYSDQRLVDARGRVLRDTLWSGRSNNHTSLASLLVANTITGAASLFRREVAELALPFPDTPGFQFHDHWIGLVALASGEIAYVDRPLYDYVQHSGAVFGDVNPGEQGGVRRGRWRLHPRGATTRWRAAYFYGYVGRKLQAQTLLARRPRTTAAKRRGLERFIACDRSPLALSWLVARSLRALAGRNETLGSEAQLALGVLWSGLARAGARLARVTGRRALDASLPGLESFEQKRLRRWRARL